MVNFFLSFSKTKRICESSRRGRGGDHVTLGVGKKAAGGECRGKAQKGKKTSCLNLPTVGDPAGSGGSGGARVCPRDLWGSWNGLHKFGFPRHLRTSQQTRAGNLEINACFFKTVSTNFCCQGFKHTKNKWIQTVSCLHLLEIPAVLGEAMTTLHAPFLSTATDRAYESRSTYEPEENGYR